MEDLKATAVMTDRKVADTLAADKAAVNKTEQDAAHVAAHKEADNARRALPSPYPNSNPTPTLTLTKH